MRIAQSVGSKGSLKWIQRLATHQPELLDDAIQVARACDDKTIIEWVSPREDDDWAEYRDSAFLARLGRPELRDALRRFWPRNGPQWDALGRTVDGTVFLLEAKAHVKELTSACSASARSRLLIEQSLAATKATLGILLEKDWLTGYYQYANRLAHLHFLRSHGVQAWLVFVYFTNDSEMKGPTSREQWVEQLCPVYEHLGLAQMVPTSGIINIYLDTQLL